MSFATARSSNADGEAPRSGHSLGLAYQERYISTSVSVESSRRQLSEPQRALEQLGVLAKPYRFRVQTDAEGFPFIPGPDGQIEWYCDGVNCASRFGGSCPVPRQFALAVYTDHPRLFEKLWAIPGVKRHQTGDTEMRAVFPTEALEQVAGVIKARRKRTLAPEEARRRGFKPTHRATSER